MLKAALFIRRFRFIRQQPNKLIVESDSNIFLKSDEIKKPATQIVSQAF